MGIVPGARRFHEAGLAVALPLALWAWPLVYLAAASAYLGASSVTGDVGRFFTRLSWSLALVLVLAILPGTYPGFREGYAYLRSLDLLYVAACWLLVALLFLREETGRLAGSFWRWAKQYPYVTWPLIVAAALYLAGELILSAFALWLEPALGLAAFSGIDKRLSVHALNVLLTAALSGAAFGLTNRLVFSILSGTTLYLALLVANLVKIKYLRTPIVPEDIHYTTELASVGPAYLGPLGITAVALAGVVLIGGLAFAFRFRGGRAGGIARAVLACFSLLMIVAVAEWSRVAPMRALVDRLDVRFVDWRPEQSLRENGLVFESLLSIGRFRVTEPPGYSATEVSRVLREYGPVSNADGEPDTPPDVNLIICMIESFLDTDDFRVRFSRDPLPSFHHLRREGSSGYVVVPIFGGKSVNTEFELLTGMSTAFFPPNMCAYTGQITRDLPSLPRFLGSHGYHTTAINGVTPAWFNRQRVYRHLNFQHEIYLGDHHNIPTDARSGLPSDEAVADAVIEASQCDAPFFIFAFPCSMHAPYEGTLNGGREIQILDAIPIAARSELQCYVNALHQTDRAVGRIIDYFEQSKEKTVIVILGDHCPAFFHGVWEAVGFFTGSDLDRQEQQHSVPVVIWKNFDGGREPIDGSVNFLAPRILVEMGLAPAGFFALGEAFGRRLRVLSPPLLEASDGARSIWSRRLADEPGTPRDYWLVQYDLMYGEGFSAPECFQVR